MQMFRFLNFNLTLLQGTKRLDCISEHLYQVLQYEPMISEFWWELNQLIALKIPTNLAGNLNITNEFLSKKSRSMTIVAKLIFFRFWLPSDAGQIGTKGPVFTLSYSVDLFFSPKTVNFFFTTHLFFISCVYHQYTKLGSIYLRFRKLRPALIVEISQVPALLNMKWSLFTLDRKLDHLKSLPGHFKSVVALPICHLLFPT